MAEKKNTRYGVWFIVILLLVGLAGFGTGGLTSNIRTLGTVGDKEISLNDYQRTLNDQIRALSAQFGTQVTFQQARAFGLDQAALNQIILSRTLDNEAAQLGISAGDGNVRDRLLSIPQFSGAGGSFNRESYRYALQQSGQSEAQFEDGLREEMSRTLLQGAVVSGIPTPDSYTDALVQYIAETRSVTWASVGADILTAPVPGATDTDIQAYYDANPEEFTLPETRQITYAWLTPSMLQDQMTVTDDAIAALYNERINEYVQPERRLVERLIFLNAEQAAAAKTRLDNGEATFEDLVAERGLRLTDIDLGDMSKADLGVAGDPVFAAAAGDVVGPIDASMGPALFRMNAILAAQETPLDEAAPALRDELAATAARDVINDGADQMIDLIAGGATLEDLADRTEMRLGTISWTDQVTDGIAAYDAFRRAAATVQEGDFAELVDLADGGLFTLRLDEITPPTVQPLDEVRDAVMTAWQAQARQDAIVQKATEIAADIQPLTGFDTLSLSPTVDEDLTRRSFIEGTPADFLDTIFTMEIGSVEVLQSEGGAVIVRLDDIAPPDMTAEGTTAQREQVGASAAAGIAQDIFDAYATRLQEQTEVNIDQTALNAINAQFQ
ncbi:peptidyl-prolyl cis-trans isomerase [Yoonia sp. SS1-5]|uniref:Peptidyl-prolyl cis-trans isomerase n=1 Tax=Yoonia rhodophyticola TaxID=3137370 RepID=A0AAN0NHV8_9RHOB